MPAVASATAMTLLCIVLLLVLPSGSLAGGRQEANKKGKGGGTLPNLQQRNNCTSHPWPYEHNTLLRGESLSPGEYLESKNAMLVFKHDDGNVVFYRKPNMEVLWSSGTVNVSAATFTLQTDGDLVIVDGNGTKLWHTNTSNGTNLVVQDNCRLVLYSREPLEAEVWSSTEFGMCITAHIVMHSHDDVGWLLTPEQYYDGCSSKRGVDSIITTVVESLSDDPARKFSQVEIYFFNRWWERQTDEMKNKTRKVVESGQLKFINAGWSMHDEACVHQESAISNMEVGAQFLRDTFGEFMNITVGWHIDPFGHASTTPRIMAQMGFDSFFFWRADYLQIDYKKRTKTMETMWAPSPSLGTSVGMFTSIMYDTYCLGCDNQLYNTPGFIMCPSPFTDYSCEQPTPWQTIIPVGLGPGSATILHELRSRARHQRAQSPRHMEPSEARLGHYPAWLPPVQDMAWGYVLTLRKYEADFRTGHVLAPWGCDFQHINAHLSFSLMDAIFNEINSNSSYGMQLVYSHPEDYIKSIKKMNYSWPRNDYDYFVYADHSHAYWSGYLSSRAEYKGYERHLMNEKLAAELILSGVYNLTGADLQEQLDNVYKFRQAMGVAQHHDSITGTERVNVRNKYQFLLAEGAERSELTVAMGMSAATGVPTFDCLLRNLSYCEATNRLGGSMEGFNTSVFIFNPLARNRTELITIPVPTKELTVVRRGAHGVESNIVAEVTKTWALTTTPDLTSPPVYQHQEYQVTFFADLMPLELVEFILVPKASGTTHYVSAAYVPNNGTSGTTIENEYYQLAFDKSTLLLDEIRNLGTGEKSKVSENVMTYCPHDIGYMSNQNRSKQSSGAYIFRTCLNDELPTPYANEATGVHVLRGPLCEEVRQYISNTSNVHQSFRVCSGTRFIEFVAGIGEVEIRPTGVEVILKFDTDLDTEKTWYTDSQALEMQRRVTDERPNYPYVLTEPVSSNFFPCNAFTFLNSTTNSKRNFVVAGDRSRATASLEDGSLEMLVQRRLVYDDGRGVAQNLNETTRVLTANRIMSNTDVLTSDMRFNSLLMTHKPIVRFSDERAQNTAPYAQFGLPNNGAGIPEEIHLHTRSVLSEGRLLLRLQHLFAVDEPGAHKYNRVVEVNLKAFMPIGATLVSAEEYDMNGVTPLANLRREDFMICDPTTAESEVMPQIPPSMAPGTTKVHLQPMDIRTYIIEYMF